MNPNEVKMNAPLFATTITDCQPRASSGIYPANHPRLADQCSPPQTTHFLSGKGRTVCRISAACTLVLAVALSASCSTNVKENRPSTPTAAPNSAESMERNLATPSPVTATNAQTSLGLTRDAAGVELPIMVALPALVCEDIVYRDARGEVKTGTRDCSGTALPDCAADAETDCRTNDDLPGVVKSSIAEKVLTGHTVGGVVGTVTVHPDCASDNQVGCVTTSVFKSADVSALAANAAQMRSTVSIAGVSGSMTTCATNGGQDCYVTGSYYAATNCAANDSNCFIGTYSSGTQPFKAINFDVITAGVIKKDVVVAGVTGLYPNASFPLPVSDAYADLTAATFNAKIIDGATFAWFDRLGVRASHTGDADILAGNIKLNEQIFGVTGSMVAAAVPDAWDVRAGVSVGGVTGKLKVNCRNGGKLSIFDTSMPRAATVGASDTITMTNHGFATDAPVRVLFTAAPTNLALDTTYYVINLTANTFKLAAASGTGTPLAVAGGSDLTVSAWGDGSLGTADTLDDFNATGATVVSATPWASTTFCSGIDDGQPSNDDKVWKDVTTGGCDATKCRFKDKISGLEWSKERGETSWGAAVAACDQAYDGVTGWRMPTQKELINAYEHGIRSAASTNWISVTDMFEYFWSATTVSDNTTSAATFTFALGRAFSDVKWNNLVHYACVR